MNRDRGRPRSFNMDTALDHALEVFWKHGFQNTSILELTTAMGLSKPSLYAAFGDKESLYLKSLERYVALRIAGPATILNQENCGRRAIEKFLRSIAAMLADPALPGGCFIINGTTDCGGSSTPVAVERALREALQGSETMINERLRRARRDGHLPRNANIGSLATLFSSLIAGMGVLAKGGAGEAKLNYAIDAAMSAWPQQFASHNKRVSNKIS